MRAVVSARGEGTMANAAARVECELCPKGCVIPAGHRGDCRARVNLAGRIVPLTFNRPVTVALDPVEKKPFFHWHPGQPILSLACAGCNLHCLGCQNWEISQANPEDVPAYNMNAAQVVAAARRQGARLIALTYTEPVVSYEYSLAIAAEATAAGMQTALVTAAYCNPDPWRVLCKAVQAATIDIKFIDDTLYRRYCDGTLAPVQRAIEIALEERVWTELSNLVIPGVNDHPGDVGRLAAWMVAALGPDVPLHLLGFTPRYKLTNLPPTPLTSLLRGREEARAAGLRHVYVGNLAVPGGADTTCPRCQATLVTRVGHRVTSRRLNETGTCPGCGAKLTGVWS